jgi:quinol monooxygenase YgiN
MSFTHLSLLSLIDPEDADRVIALVESAGGRFPGVAHWAIARNENPRKEHDLVFVSVFNSEADYRVYQQDPAHHALSAEVGRYLAGSSGVDFRGVEIGPR